MENTLRPVTLDIVRAAQRANAAYFTHPDQSKAVFEHLGYIWIGMYQNGSSQAVLSTDGTKTYLSISGTRASALRLEDIFLDVDLTPINVGPVKPAMVTSGVHADLLAIWTWAFTRVPAGTIFNVDGHSLGGARTQLTPLFVAADHIGDLYSFESPKFAEASYFDQFLSAMPRLVCTLNGADGWAAWPWVDNAMIRPPIPHLWLHGATYSWIQPHDWPGGMDFADHDIDTVVRRLQLFYARESGKSTPP